ncbi:lipase family protein [Nocardia cyriacigeorgica]|uniref:lipase family protein n=1 Tax=Nocardia cyriacigeorgica TaxID=135487 RepID=UPI0013D2F0BF|nr:lipase family protein [Nocardia cyriacigeorgica]MBF6452694.1 lipase [Nocardia cyriacigeorgica]MBF6476566.1 lipase [Nocardia cyriacigeorgica]MBF6549863.1 lipase [Nocardia cyriacigeorgica]NEW25535.1 lipase [Nocardia cyriacigeorgica]
MQVIQRLITGALLGASAVLLAGTVPAPALPRYPVADPDPFYAQPADLAAYQPGDVLAVRRLPPLLTFPGSTLTLVKFRSTNSRGLPIAATTTVVTPPGHRPDGPLLSYQHIINGLGPNCAVSRVLYTSDPNLQVREAVALNALLLRGWSIALPDHLGPTFAYGAAKLGGQITLDGIRAVQRVPELAVQHSPVAMAGYSGGGMATAWAAALAPSYAPELKLAGAAAGGVPANLMRMIEALQFDPHPAFGLVLAAAIGLEREYPHRFPISDNLNAAGIAARDAMANGCTNDILATGAGRSVRDYASNTSLMHDADARAVLEENSIELFDGVPNMPIFEWHSPTDPLIPVDSLVSINRRYCAAGVPVQAETIPTPEHLSAAVLGMPLMVAWLDARFRGEPAPSNC